MLLDTKTSSFFVNVPSLELQTSQVAQVRNGASLEANGEGEDLVRLLDGPNLVAVYRVDGPKLVPEVVLG